jgi:putative addiction module component (TIGR02574 family)
MTEVALRLKDQLLQLSDEDRVELARILWDSIDEGFDEEAVWDAELDRRFEEIETGKAIGEPARQVIEELREKHK